MAVQKFRFDPSPRARFTVALAAPGRFPHVFENFWRDSGAIGRRGFFLFRVLGGALLPLAVSCAGGTNPPANSGSQEATSDPSLTDAKPLPPLGRSVARPEANDWSLDTHRRVVLLTQNLVLSLPQGHVWESAPRRGTWSGLRHAATDSEIWVRHVPARRTISLEECEKETRLSWPLIREVDEDASYRVLRAPAGYGGKLSVTLLPLGGGRVEAFSVGVSRCLAVIFTTGSTPGFPERLRVIGNEVIETLRVPDVGERSRAVRFSPF